MSYKKKRQPLTIGRLFTYLLLYAILLLVVIWVLYPLLFTVFRLFLGDSLAGLCLSFQQNWVCASLSVCFRIPITFNGSQTL